MLIDNLVNIVESSVIETKMLLNKVFLMILVIYVQTYSTQFVREYKGFFYNRFHKQGNNRIEFFFLSEHFFYENRHRLRVGLR